MPLTLDPISITTEFATRFGLDPTRLDPDAPLFSSGRLGYLEMAETLDWIEEQMGIRIEARDVRMEHIDTTRSMCELVGRKLGATVIEIKPVGASAPTATATVG